MRTSKVGCTCLLPGATALEQCLPSISRPVRTGWHGRALLGRGVYVEADLEQPQSIRSGVYRAKPWNTTSATGGGRYDRIENALACVWWFSAHRSRLKAQKPPGLQPRGSGRYIGKRLSVLSRKLAAESGTVARAPAFMPGVSRAT